MVEFLKEATSDSYVEPGMLRNKSISETTGFDMLTGSAIGKVEKSSKILKINLLFYFSSAVSTLILFLPQVRGFFSDIGWRWVHILGLSFSISFFLNPIFAWIAKKLNILDIPDSRKLHKEATPLLGGAAVFVAFSIALLTNGIFSKPIVVILIASLILFGIGILDDIREVSAGLKLLTQLACSLLVMSSGIILHVLPVDLGSHFSG
ncbi:MAG: hypothetical protein P8185_26055 [Deltaproteobacteria bacterium]